VLNPVAGYGNPATGYGLNHTAVYGMQAEVKTLAANSAFIPLSVGGGAAGHPHHIRPTPLQINRSHYQPKYQNANSYYNRTKRKRDSSSGSASHTPLRGGSPGNLSNMPPWVQPDNPYSKEPIIGLHEEINDFYQWITPTQEEHYMRLGVVGRIEACVKKLWPSAALHIFGSFRTGLYLPTSDIDLALFGKWETLPLRTLEAALLEDDIADPATLKVLDKASVPIIKMMDKRTRVRVDVSFNMVNGIKSVELVKMYKKKYPPLSKLIYVLKQFLLQRDLNEVFTGGLSSYCLILMVVSFLQVHARHDVVDEDANLGVLLLEFFELYGKNFDYQSLAIRVTGSGAYVPKDEIQEEMPAGSRPSLLCVEDPLQPGNDVGKSSYGALRVRQAFDYAFGVLERSLAGVAEAPTLLSTIIQVDPATVEYRDWIRTSFSIPQEVKDGSVSPIPEPDVVPGSNPAPNHQHPATPPPTPPATPPSPKTNNNNNSVEGKDVVVTVLDDDDDDEDDDVIIVEETEEECEEEEEVGEESDDIPSSPDRPSSPELIDLTHEDEDNNSTTSSNNEADNNVCIDTPAMSISPVTSEAGDDVRSAKPKCNTTAVLDSPSPVPTSTSPAIAAEASTQQAPKKNATRASKPLYKPPVARYSNWNGAAPASSGSKKMTMTRADLDMNWRASARGPGSDQSSNSGGEVVTSKRYNDKADKDGWKENTKPPSGSKSRKHAEGKRDVGKKDDNRVANNTSYNHHISSPTDKRLNHHHKSDTKNRKENRNRKHEMVATKNGNTKSKQAAESTGDASVESSSSGIGSTTSSRLSSGGSSDAVDSCAATPPANRPAQRVPDLHGGEPAIIQVAGGVANKGNNAKECLSRRASASSCNISIDNKTHAALSSPVNNPELNALVKKSKKKRKKHELNGATNKENGFNGVSRDSSPGGSGGNVGSKSDNKTVIQNSKNASTRFSCEAGPRIPKR